MLHKYTILKTIVLSFILLLCCSATAQTDSFRHQKDAVRRTIAQQQGKEKIQSYKSLSGYCFRTCTDEASLRELLDVLDQFWKEAEKQHDPDAKGYIIRSKTDALYNLSKWEELETFVLEHLDFLLRNELWDDYYPVYQALIDAHLSNNRLEEAVSEADIMLKNAQRTGHTEGQIAALYSVANAYGTQGRYPEAIDYYKKCIDLQSELDDVSNFALYACYNLSDKLLGEAKYPEALDILQKWEYFIIQTEERDKYRNHSERSKLYLNYTIMYEFQKDYDKAEYYCELADKESENPRMKVNIALQKAQIHTGRNRFDKALEAIDYALSAYPEQGLLGVEMLMVKGACLANLGRAEESFGTAMIAYYMKDSILNMQFNAQLDELRTRYEVDKHITEKERHRNYLFFALAGCVLLFVLLAIRIYYHRQIIKKNYALSQQIKELTAQQKLHDDELLNKLSFIDENAREEDDFCPARRKDKLCVAIRDLILRDKIYRNPTITRDYVIERLDTSRELFVEAFMYCFGMSFTEYINSLRLKDAVSLLEQSDLSIEDVSKKTGFGTVRTFQRQFQTKYNMSPKDYRNSAMLT